jgi:glycosyltransferase involved in cell wall biosynthesis
MVLDRDVMKPIQSKQSPQVSVIIPAYNTAALIAGCLDSVFSQTHQDFEVIVVNDGSPDSVELERVLRPYQDRIVYIVQQNKRAAGARNTAIGRARGEFLAFLDSDDRWLPGHLASQMKLFTEGSALDMVYCNGLRIGDQRNFMDACPSHGPATFAALITERCQICVSTVVVRKSAIVRAGLFDESLLRCDDYEMWVRAAFHGTKIGYSRKVQALLNGGRPGSLSQSSFKMAEGYWTILDNISQTFPLNDSDRTVVEKRKREIMSRYLVEEGKVQLHQRQFDKAKELFSEANQHSRRLKLDLVLLGLRIAPQATNRFFSLLTRIRSGTPA